MNMGLRSGSGCVPALQPTLETADMRTLWCGYESAMGGAVARRARTPLRGSQLPGSVRVEPAVDGFAHSTRVRRRAVVAGRHA